MKKYDRYSNFKILFTANISPKSRRNSIYRPSFRNFSSWQSKLVTCIVLLACTLAQAAEIPQSGSGWPALNPAVDKLITEHISEKDIPGMTVAVSVKGRQVYRKAFGYARKSTKLVPMLPDHLTMLGSTTKPLITGAAGNQLLLIEGIDPKTKLYGAGSVFGNKFNDDISIGIKRSWPISATAVSSDNKLYTWYMNGTYSIGTSEILDYHSEPKPFTMPNGKTTTDITGIAISANNWVHTWYIDGSHSVGLAYDLDSRTAIQLNNKGEPIKTKIPKGAHSFSNVTAIAIGKVSNRVYVWYLNGKYSIGNTKDFGAHAELRPFSMGGESSLEIRGIGIAPNRRAYTLLSNGKRIKGKVSELASITSAGSYTMPGISFGPPRYSAGKWIRELTLQNLLDHKAGFGGGGDTKSAVEMFGVSDYEHVHKHFLRTGQLMDPPNTRVRYSNHGFGLWTLVIERYSGKSYRNYVTSDYLKPIGLGTTVKPLSESKDRYDACPHRYKDGGVKVRKHWTSKNGLAAGGWTGSATSVLRITRHLNNTYTQKQLDEFGWFKSDRGRLDHNGLVPNGGSAYVSMYPAGYKVGGTGDDLSDVHIALAANIDTSTSGLSLLARRIAVQVAKHQYPGSFDLFKVKYTNLNYQSFDCK